MEMYQTKYIIFSFSYPNPSSYSFPNPTACVKTFSETFLKYQSTCRIFIICSLKEDINQNMKNIFKIM